MWSMKVVFVECMKQQLFENFAVNENEKKKS